MRPDNLLLQLLAGLLAIASALAGIFLLLIAVLFRGNFHFGNLWHCFVFVVTSVAPFLALIGFVRYLRLQTWKSFGLSLIGSALIVITWLLWIAPLSRGLMH